MQIMRVMSQGRCVLMKFPGTCTWINFYVFAFKRGRKYAVSQCHMLVCYFSMIVIGFWMGMNPGKPQEPKHNPEDKSAHPFHDGEITTAIHC
jgi:hypothetical protein